VSRVDPKVSVVIPAYNVEPWIAAAIESVLNQTCSDLEVIVVDDGSTDSTPQIVGAFNEPRVRLVAQSNQGPTSARNTGFDEARGEYIALLDADDEYNQRFLERTIAFLDKNPAIGIVATNQFLVSRDGRKEIAFGHGSIRYYRDSPAFVDYCRTRLVERCFPSNTAMVLRASLLPNMGGYDPTIIGGEELELMLRWTSSTRLGYIPEPLATHFDRPGSFIKDLDRSIRARIHLWRQVLLEDSSYLAALPGYALLRNMCLFRIAAIAIAAGYFRQAEEIAILWPSSPRDRYWWMGRTLLSLPHFSWKIVHSILGRTDAVRLRNDPGSKYGGP
jgi:glycosyltransferase involved in cell wall biosynthesis